MLDMFIGGVTMSGEKPIQTLFRELREECGLDVLSVSAGDDAYGDTRVWHRTRESSNDDSESDTVDSSQLSNGNGGTSKLAWKSAVEVAFRRYQRSLGQSATIDAEVEFREGYVLRFIGQTIIATELNHCLVHVYFLQLSEAQSSQISFADGEIEWGRWVSFPDLDALLAAAADDDDIDGPERFVPDGMQVCRRALCDAVVSVL